MAKLIRLTLCLATDSCRLRSGTGPRTHLFVLLLLGGSLESLPGEGAAVEVHEHVAQGLHVVPPALLDTQVGVDGGVARRPRQVLVLSAEKKKSRLENRNNY